MFKPQYSLFIALFLFFATTLELLAQPEVIGRWRDAAVVEECGPVFEVKAAQANTNIDPDFIPTMVLFNDTGGDVQLGILNVANYLNSSPPAIPIPELTTVNVGTNDIFSITAPIGNALGQNVTAACLNGFPGDPYAIITDGNNLVDMVQISADQCNDIDLTTVDGVLFASIYNGAGDIVIKSSDDGGQLWGDWFVVNNTCGISDECIGHASAAGRDGNGNSLICNVHGTPDGPNNFWVSTTCINIVNLTTAGPAATGNIAFSNRFGGVIAESNMKIVAALTAPGEPDALFATFPTRSNDLNFEWSFAGGDTSLEDVAMLSGSIQYSNAPDRPVITGGLAPLDGIFDNPFGNPLAAFASIFLQNAMPDPPQGINNQQAFALTDEEFEELIGIRIGDNPYQGNNELVDFAPVDLGRVDVNGQPQVFGVGSGNSCIVTELLLNQGESVPTLNEWGLIALSGLILLFGAFVLRRRAQAVSN